MEIEVSYESSTIRYEFYPNRNLRKKMIYDSGDNLSNEIYFSPSKKMSWENKYKDGKPIGKFKKFDYLGFIEQDAIYDESGKLLWKCDW